jgi:hypothetical protein
MARHEATSEFSVSSWDEQPYRERSDAPKLTMAEVVQTYTGSLTGTSEIRYLMLYPDNGVTTFTGIESFAGSLDGRDGALAIRWNGADDGTAARGVGTIIPGSATGALAGISGDASYEAGRSGEVTMSLSYELA